MFKDMFDIVFLEEVAHDTHSIIERVRRVLSSDDDHKGLAFLLGSKRHPMLVLYRHWYETGSRYSSGSHGVDSLFVDLSCVSSAEHEGDDLILRGEEGFIRVCDSWHHGTHQPDIGDPLAGYGESEATSDTILRVEGACACWNPSPLDIVSRYITDRDAVPSASVPKVESSQLESSRALCGQLWRWLREHPDEEAVEYDKREKRRRWGGGMLFVMLLAVSGLLVFLGLAHGAVKGEFGLFDIGGLLAIVTCVAFMFGMMPGFRRAMVESSRQLMRSRIVEDGQVSVLCEEGTRYLLVREDPVPLLWSNDDMTRYTLVRLAGENLRPAYDENTYIMTFQGDDIWQTDSIRCAVDRIIVPSIDTGGMERIPSYQVADTFVPSLRTVIRMVRADTE